METEPQNLTLLIQGERFVVNNKIVQVSDLVKNMTEMFPNQDIPIDAKITIPIMKRIVEYCEMHDFAPPAIKKPIKSSKLQEIFCPNDYNFVKDLDYKQGNEMPALIESSIYFQMQSLRDLLIATIAADFFCGDDEDSYAALAKKHKVKQDISLNEEFRLRQEYPWIDE